MPCSNEKTEKLPTSNRFNARRTEILKLFFFPVLEKVAERKYPTDVHSSLFVQMFVACVACAIDPVLLVRLLAHRLVTTPLYPRNSSSITSMSGQDQFPPRTCRSRASSTDTNASIRRKRVCVHVVLTSIVKHTNLIRL